MAKNKLNDLDNPLVVLMRILSNALLEDKYGVNETAYSALLLLLAAVNKDVADEIKKKSKKTGRRFRYED